MFISSLILINLVGAMCPIKLVFTQPHEIFEILEILEILERFEILAMQEIFEIFAILEMI